MRFWVSSGAKLSESWQPRSLDIEVAAYALLSHFRQRKVSEGFPVMRWLSRQRNSLGGFASTQVSNFLKTTHTYMYVCMYIHNRNLLLQFFHDFIKFLGS